VGPVSIPLRFWIDDGALGAVQASLVALPGAGAPVWVGRLASSRWALVLPGSIAVVIGGLALAPGAADAITWLALIAIPPLAALALGWAMRGARPLLALAVVPLVALALAYDSDHPIHHLVVGQSAAVILSALSCVTLGRLLAVVAPLWALEIGIVTMATLDAILVFSNGLQQPNDVLVTAIPHVAGFHLPQLQVANFDFAQIGYGDLFIAGVLGGVVAKRAGPPLVLALATFATALAFDQLFWVRDELPATAPVALVTIAWWGCRRWLSTGARAPGTSRGHRRRVP
jgi:hypothetical protein